MATANGRAKQYQLAMLKAVESGKKKKKVAGDFGIALTTLCTILSSKEAVVGAVARGDKSDRKKLRAPAFEAVQKVVFKWFLEARASRIPGSAALLQRKGRDLACIMGHDDFVASAGWLQRFKERHDIVSRAVSSGAQSVDHAVAWVVKNVTATRKVQPKR